MAATGVATALTCKRCGRVFRARKGLTWHREHFPGCAGASPARGSNGRKAALPGSEGSIFNWHDGQTCEQAHPGVGHATASFARYGGRSNGASPAVVRPAGKRKARKATKRKLATESEAVNAANGAAAVEPNRSPRGHGRPTGGRVHAESMPPDWLCDKNGKPLVGVCRTRAQAKHDRETALSFGGRIDALTVGELPAHLREVILEILAPAA